MKIYDQEEFNSNKRKLLNKIKKGNIFIYPTDTIYGIGCDATNFNAVEKIKEIKGRDEKPFSVVAPSKEWIFKNCEIDELTESWINRLPGHYTLILRLSRKKCIAKNVNLDKNTIGVRIPKHWFSDVIKDLNLPIVTTSVNKSSNDFMTSMNNLNHDIKEKVDFIVYEGEKNNRPSDVIDLSKDSVFVEER